MNTLGMALLGLLFLSGCGSGGVDDPSVSRTITPPSQGIPQVQPEMLTKTNDGLLRGRADGQGQRLIFAKPGLFWLPVSVTQGQVLYSDQGDVWAVRTDGTNDRAVLNTPAIEFISTVTGPWIIYGKETQPPGITVSYGSVNIETGAQFNFDDSDGTQFMPASPTRLISTTSQRQISSLSVTGTDRITYASLTHAEMQGGGTFLSAMQIVNNTLIYSRSGESPTFYSRGYAIPLAGGTAVLLDEERYDTNSGWSVGDRMVYHRCDTALPPGYRCDVASVQTNGTHRAILTTHPANEAVQGVIGDQVIIRRNLSFNSEELIAVPVTGGPERFLMTMTDRELVQLIAGDLMIISRPSGTWSLDLNGVLTQLGTVTGEYSSYVAVGDAVCLNQGPAVWCLPLDGQGPATKIADEGFVVAVVTP